MTVSAPVIRELVLLGDSDPARRGGKALVAESHCEFRLADDAALRRCVEALRASDARLAQNPDSPYDWQRTWVERVTGTDGGTIVFGVSWYDEEFFSQRKNVFREQMHQRIFDHLGIEAQNVTVSHWRPVAA